MQVKYSIFGMNNVVYFFHMMCFLNKSSLVKNFYLSSVLPVDPVTYIMTNITFLLKSSFIARHETRNFKLPWDIFGDHVNVIIWCWSEHQNQSCWACQTQMASRSACPACQTGWAKTGNESSARREIWDRSLARSVLGCEGTKPFFPCLWDVISRYQWSL